MAQAKSTLVCACVEIMIAIAVVLSVAALARWWL
jgi:hypothetical protein